MRLVFVVALFYVAVAKEARFDGYKVYRMLPKTAEQNELIMKMERSDEFDFWTHSNPAGLPVDVMIPPQDQENFIQLMNLNGIEFDVFINDVQEKISKMTVRNGTRSGMTWTTYHTLDDIHDWLRSLPREYPGIVEVFSAGSSGENRDLKAVKISFKPGKRGVFIEGGIHAREWISPATVTYIINELLTSKDAKVRKMAESFDWYILPSLNPDGYVFSHNQYRLHRKNTAIRGRACIGVDLNRNFDFYWREEGTSENPCSEAYGGPSVFSETESSTFAHYLKKIAHKLDVYLSFHSYSQIMLLPYGNSSEHLSNYADTYSIGTIAAEALAQRYGTKYKVGNVAEILYAATGTSMDYVKNTHNIPIVYTYELRDTGRNGFLLPAEEIMPNCEEVMDSVVAIFAEAAKLNYFTLDED